MQKLPCNGYHIFSIQETSSKIKTVFNILAANNVNLKTILAQKNPMVLVCKVGVSACHLNENDLSVF